MGNEIPKTQGLSYRIVCTKSYEFEQHKFTKGEISWHSWGRNVPKNWEIATKTDLENYIKSF